jgi:hypothetical protein
VHGTAVGEGGENGPELSTPRLGRRRSTSRSRRSALARRGVGSWDADFIEQEASEGWSVGRRERGRRRSHVLARNECKPASDAASSAY